MIHFLKTPLDPDHHIASDELQSFADNVLMLPFSIQQNHLGSDLLLHASQSTANDTELYVHINLEHAFQEQVEQ